MCIYYGNQKDLSYNSKEHIFPATIGGMKTLPKGYVSDKANSYFSKLESRIVTASFIGLEKMFFGPGERGTNKPGRMPITLLISNYEERLGFSFNGKPHYIPQIVLSKDLRQCNITRDTNLQTNNDITKLIDKLTNFNNEYTLISNKPQSSAFLVGLYKNRLYISVYDKDKVGKFIEFINNHMPDKVNYSDAKESTNEGPKVMLNMTVDIADDARIFAKVAMNVLADLKGAGYFENPQFNEIKRWLLGEDNDKFKQMPSDGKLMKLLINDDSKVHYCMIMNIDNSLAAIVSFYNHWTMGFEICESFDVFFNIPFVYFCDWQNKKEYTLNECIGIP